MRVLLNGVFQLSTSYFPVDNNKYFDGCEMSIIDWMRQYSTDETDTYLRGFLGRMLFSGDDVYKKVNVLSGGEKVRCMFSRMMLFALTYWFLTDLPITLILKV